MIKQLTTFIVEDIMLAVDIRVVKEVYRQMTLSPIPAAPPEFRGLVNLRGKIVTVIDLNVYLDKNLRKSVDGTRLLILKTVTELAVHDSDSGIDSTGIGEDIVGLIIDRMDEVIEVDEKEILPPVASSSEGRSGVVNGVVKLDDRLILMLDLSVVLDRAMNSIPKF